VLIPLGLGYAFDVLEIGLPIALSVVAISPSDIPGNQRHLYGGLLVATLLAAISSALVNLTAPYWYLLLPTMFVLTFGNAYISLGYDGIVRRIVRDSFYFSPPSNRLEYCAL